MKRKRQKTGILERLQFHESFQIETDLPLEECVLRLNGMQNSLRKFSREHPYRIVPVRQLQDRLFSMQLIGHGRAGFSVYVKIILWSENEVNFISGETQIEGLDGLFFMYLVLGIISFFSSSILSYFWVFGLIYSSLLIVVIGWPSYLSVKNIRIKFIQHLQEIISNEPPIDSNQKTQG